VKEPTDWIVVARIEDDRPRDWWFRIVDGEVLHDMRALVADLAELVWDERPLRRVEPPKQLLEVIAARERFLRAARHAPAPLDLDAPEVRAWRLLCSEAAGLSKTGLDDVRGRLLRRHPAGVRRRLEQFVERGTDGLDALLRYARSLAPPESTDVEIRLVACLGTRGLT
jgi:hypothetical protein